MELKCNLPNVYFMLLFISVLTQALSQTFILCFLFICQFWIVDKGDLTFMVIFWDLNGDELREENEVSDCRIPSVTSKKFQYF